ncbi:MAG TPA: phospholipase domain-containing protein, partial [Caulobacteraceae bacterium]|nr:phospholipase domain-containing protein [Caulobacteraceae bacterium]
EGLALTIGNTGAAGAGFILYATAGGEPRFYTVEAGKSLDDLIPLDGAVYSFNLHGPNGFLRGFSGNAKAAVEEVSARFDPASGKLVMTLINRGDPWRTMSVMPNAYLPNSSERFTLGSRAELIHAWDISKSGHWYDFTVRGGEPGSEWRIAGHGEDGRPSVSDPLFGRPA